MEASSRNPDTSSPNTLSSRANSEEYQTPLCLIPSPVKNHHFHHVVAGSLVSNIFPRIDNMDVDRAPRVVITVGRLHFPYRHWRHCLVSGLK